MPIRPIRWKARDAMLCLILLLALAPSAQAGATMDHIAPPLRKLGRGLANMTTGGLELPYKICAVNDEQGPLAAISVGVVAGVGAAVTRTVAGMVEVGTFLFPLGQYGYGPLIKPEFLLLPDHS